MAIESSCDDTSAAVIQGNVILSNLIANQQIHAEYGGVVPELASRAHQQNIVPVVQTALKKANKELKDLDAIAVTKGPGLLGSLLVGHSFAKGLAMSLSKPLIAVNHMHAHILAHFIKNEGSSPDFPFICLTVSGGHTQLVKVKTALDMEIIGQTSDDAAGEAFDKTAKMLGFEYPGGPLIDKHAKDGNPKAFQFPISRLKNYSYSFSGFKTSVLYFLQKAVSENPNFIEENLNDLCASIQYTIIKALFYQLEKSVEDTGIKEVAIAGGVSANSGLREALKNKQDWNTYIPPFEYCTDNAAMIAIAAQFKYQENQFESLDAVPKPRMEFKP